MYKVLVHIKFNFFCYSTPFVHESVAQKACFYILVKIICILNPQITSIACLLIDPSV